jgi:hypothetical protein
MADLVFNIAKGRIAAYAQNVEDASPANCALLVIPFNSTATDATIKDLDTLAAIEADANTAECTGSTWSRKSVVAANLTIQVDDTNDWVDIDIDNQTWTAVAASNNATHLLIAYDSDTTAGTDSNIIPLTWHTFAVTTDGSDITAVIDTEGFFRAT